MFICENGEGRGCRGLKGNDGRLVGEERVGVFGELVERFGEGVGNEGGDGEVERGG